MENLEKSNFNYFFKNGLIPNLQFWIERTNNLIIDTGFHEDLLFLHQTKHLKGQFLTATKQVMIFLHTMTHLFCFKKLDKICLFCKWEDAPDSYKYEYIFKPYNSYCGYLIYCHEIERTTVGRLLFIETAHTKEEFYNLLEEYLEITFGFRIVRNTENQGSENEVWCLHETTSRYD